MRRVERLLLVVALVMAPVLARAQKVMGKPEVAVGSGKIDLPFGETTEVKGKIPIDLNGYWLVSENHELRAGKVFPALQLYRIGADAKGKLVVNWFDFKPPAAVAGKLLKAQQTQQAWSPDKDDVAAIAAAVAANPPAVDAKLRGRHVVSLDKQFDARVKKAPEAKGARFAIQSLFQPGDRPPYGQSYYVMQFSKGELSGAFTMGAVPMNSIGVPLPVGTKGKFRWVRLAALAAPKAADATRTPDAAKAKPGAAAPEAAKPH